MVKPAATILTLMLVAALGCTNQSVPTVQEAPPKQNSTADSSEPLSITLDNEGRFAEGSPWTLTVKPDLSAILEIRAFPDKHTRAFTLTHEQMAGLRSNLLSERFFDLDNEYGQLVPDGSTQTITVQLGEQTKTAKLHFLMNWVHNDPSKLENPARAVRVWRHCRSWFSDDGAVDLGRYDQMVFDAVANR